MNIIIYIIIGFIAQMIDGTLGMAYGVTCRTFLTTFSQVPFGVSSAIVHYAEIPTSFASMIAHIKYKNVNKKMFLKLITTGIIGSVIGAYIITRNLGWIELVVDIYLMIMGIVILSKAFQKRETTEIENSTIGLYSLGFVGAFLDASGGGGYGPIVTGTLLPRSSNPKKVIGTVNSSEFLVTLASSITFILFITNIKKYLFTIVGLIIGGTIAAPIAAKLCMKLDEKKLFFLVGTILVILNIYNIINYLR